MVKKNLTLVRNQVSNSLTKFCALNSFFADEKLKNEILIKPAFSILTISSEVTMVQRDVVIEYELTSKPFSLLVMLASRYKHVKYSFPTPLLAYTYI